MVKAIHSGAHRFSPEKTININKELNKKAATIFNQIVAAFFYKFRPKSKSPSVNSHLFFGIHFPIST